MNYALRFAILIAAAGAASCAPFNPERSRGRPNDERVQARWIKLTALSAFYGTYQIASLSEALKKRASDLNCQTTTEIGNANIPRYVRESNGGVRLDAIVLDAYDPKTKRPIRTDEIWIATGPETAKGECTDFAIPVFDDRGQWTKLENGGLSYEFDGDVFKKASGKNFVVDHIQERIVLQPVDGEVHISVRHQSTSESDKIDKTWRFTRLKSDESAGPDAGPEEGSDNDGED